MKKIVFTIFIFITIFNTVVKSQKVSLSEAIKVAEITTKSKAKNTYIDKSNVIAFTDKKNTDTLLYICKLKERGYIIVSADKNIPPVLGWCKKGVFNMDSLPPGLIYLLNKYQYETKQIRETKFNNELNRKEWDLYIKKGVQPVSSSKGSVSPMLHTKWSQQDGFNQEVPNLNAAGCTAVAMAQILRYWACKIKPKGVLNNVDIGLINYQWCQMGDTIADQYNTRLIYHAGLSCKTEYGSKSKGGGGSSSRPNKARNGFVNNWGISSDADVKWRMAHPFNWKKKLQGELRKGRPLLYSGGSLDKSKGKKIGHSWVIDGYSGNKFHCNWGWRKGNHNNYFSLGGFNPTGNSYNELESAIFDVKPVNNEGVIGTPSLSEKSFNYSNTGYYIITIPEVYNATSYIWSTDYGTIVGNERSIKLYTNRTTNVKVKAYNNCCNIYSSEVSALIKINYIAGPDLICDQATYAINGLPTGATVSWNKDNNNLQIISGQGTSQVVVQKTNDGIGSIRATITVGNNSINTIKNDIKCGSQPKKFGIYDTDNEIINRGFINHDYYVMSYDNSVDLAEFDLLITDDYGNIYTEILRKKQNSPKIYDFSFSEEGYYTFSLKYSGECGYYSEPVVRRIYFGYDEKKFKISLYPTYASDNITVNLQKKPIDKTKFIINKPYDIEIWDNYKFIRTLNTKSLQTKIPISNLKSGYYFIVVKINGKKYRQQFFKE